MADRAPEEMSVGVPALAECRQQPPKGGTQLRYTAVYCRSPADAVETRFYAIRTPEHTMKLISYQSDRGPRIAGLRGNEIIDLHDADPALPSCPKALLAQGPEAIGRAEKALATGRPVTGPVTWLPPIPSPEKIVCIGLNYADHARETKATVPSCPVVFNKFPSSLVAARRDRPFAAGQRASRLRSRVGAGDRPPRPLHSPARGPQPHRRLHLRQRRFGPRLAEEQARRAMAFRQEFRHLRALRPLDGHGRRDPRPGKARRSSCASTGR